MDRAEFEKYIAETYNSEKDYPWAKFPDYTAFRHKNKKCFAFVLDIPKEKLGLHGDEYISVVNLKCDPLLIGSLVLENGIFAGYHMSKEHWITVLLDGSVPDEKIKMLTDLSFEITMQKNKKIK